MGNIFHAKIPNALLRGSTSTDDAGDLTSMEICSTRGRSLILNVGLLTVLAQSKATACKALAPTIMRMGLESADFGKYQRFMFQGLVLQKSMFLRSKVQKVGRMLPQKKIRIWGSECEYTLHTANISVCVPLKYVLLSPCWSYYRAQNIDLPVALGWGRYGPQAGGKCRMQGMHLFFSFFLFTYVYEEPVWQIGLVTPPIPLFLSFLLVSWRLLFYLLEVSRLNRIAQYR